MAPRSDCVLSSVTWHNATSAAQSNRRFFTRSLDPQAVSTSGIQMLLLQHKQRPNIIATLSLGPHRTAHVHVACESIEEFRTKALKAVDIYLKKPEDERRPCMFVLDSLGMLSTEKEIRDALDDKQVRDMTKSQLVKGAFRMLTLKLGQANVPLIVTNHTYDVIGAYVPTKEMGGGSGLKYAASTIIYLSKKKEKDGTAVVGNLIKAKTHKSRLSKENKDVTVRLYYDERGLDRYYGLLELGELGGLWKNVAGRYEIDGKKVYAKAILKDPETYFTPEVLEQLDQIARKEFSYGEG